MNRYFFTFGSEKGVYPFVGGWVEVVANDINQADLIFRAIYPNPQNLEFGAYCSCYTEEQFKATKMHKSGNCGKKRHAVIRVEVCKCINC